MNATQQSLAQRRLAMHATIVAQRSALAGAIAPWRLPLSLADQGIAAARYLGRHPVLGVGAVAAIAILRPTRLFGWLERGWLGWKIIQALRGK